MKWALVIGSSGDIGTQIALDLAAEGWSLYLHFAHNEKKTNELYQELNQNYPKQDFIPIKADLLDENCIDQIVDSIFSVNAVIFAQGTTYYQLFKDFPKEQIEQILKIQLQMPVLLLQRLEEKLAQNDYGRIVFISSIYGKTGSAMEVPYSMVKGAINTFVKAYSKEVASLNITVNAVAPGAVDTQMNANFDEETLTAIKEEIPVGHLANPAEISYWVKVLLDKKASYMTGQTLYVTGGWLD